MQVCKDMKQVDNNRLMACEMRKVWVDGLDRNFIGTTSKESDHIKKPAISCQGGILDIYEKSFEELFFSLLHFCESHSFHEYTVLYNCGKWNDMKREKSMNRKFHLKCNIEPTEFFYAFENYGIIRIQDMEEYESMFCDYPNESLLKLYFNEKSKKKVGNFYYSNNFQELQYPLIQFYNNEIDRNQIHMYLAEIETNLNEIIKKKGLKSEEIGYCICIRHNNFQFEILIKACPKLFQAITGLPFNEKYIKRKKNSRSSDIIFACIEGQWILKSDSKKLK